MKKYFCMAFLMPLFLISCNNSDKQYDASGVFETTEVTISSRGNGEIIRLNLEEGQTVKQSEVVGCIDTTQLYLQKKQLLANIGIVESHYYNVSRQMASIRQQITNEQQEQTRYEKLLKANAANQKQLDDIKDQIALLRKELDAKKEDLQNNNRSISSQTLSIEAQIAQIDNQMEKDRIVSPIFGTVLAKYAEQGELASQGRAIFKVADLTRIYLRTYVTAGQLTQLKIGQQVNVYADSGDNDHRKYCGKVTWISDKAEFTPKTIQTRDERANLVYAVKISVKNDGFIKRGMYGDVNFQH